MISTSCCSTGDQAPRRGRGPARSAAAPCLPARRCGARGLPQEKRPTPFHEMVPGGRGPRRRDAVDPRHLGRRRRSFCDLPGRQDAALLRRHGEGHPGSGGLYSATIDPWKCSGCLDASTSAAGRSGAREQDEALLDSLQTRFDFLSRPPDTPARSSTARSRRRRHQAPDARPRNYYATTGGHGACRGCGEVTAIRLVTTTNHAIQTSGGKVTPATWRA